MDGGCWEVSAPSELSLEVLTMPKSTIYKSMRLTLIVGVLGFLCLNAMRLACTQKTVFTAATSPSGRLQVISTTSSAGAWDGG